MFAADFEPAPMARRRKAPRAPASIGVATDAPVEATADGMVRALCKVIDVSCNGCRLETYSPLIRGSTIWLNLPGIGRVAADVVWSSDFAAGCQFHRPLDPPAVAGLAARHG